MQTQSTSSASDRTKVWDLVKDIKFAMMVTQDPDGSLHGRPMSAVVCWRRRAGAPGKSRCGR